MSIQFSAFSLPARSVFICPSASPSLPLSHCPSVRRRLWTFHIAPSWLLLKHLYHILYKTFPRRMSSSCWLVTSLDFARSLAAPSLSLPPFCSLLLSLYFRCYWPPPLPCLALCPAAVQGAYKFNSLLFVSLLGSSFSGLEIFKISWSWWVSPLIDQNKLSVDSLVQINCIVDSAHSPILPVPRINC